MNVAPLTNSPSPLARALPPINTTTKPFSGSSTSNSPEDPTTLSDAQLQVVTKTSGDNTNKLMDILRGTKANKDDGNKGRNWLDEAKNNTRSEVPHARHARALDQFTHHYGISWHVRDATVHSVQPVVMKNGVIRNAGIWSNGWSGNQNLYVSPSVWKAGGYVFGLNVKYQSRNVYFYEVCDALSEGHTSAYRSVDVGWSGVNGNDCQQN